MMSAVGSSFIIFFKLGFECPELSNYQIVLEAKSRKVIEHSLRATFIRGAAMRPNALLNGPVNQRLFADLFKDRVERFVNRLPRDLLAGKLPRHSRPADWPHVHARACVTVREQVVVNVPQLFQTRDA